MEYELVNRRRHPHPLLFEREGKCNGVCCRCRLQMLYKPSFRCSDPDCNFQIHQSCLHLPHKISSPFHTQQPLSFKSSVDHCQACGHTPSSDEVYWCKKCSFRIDINCAVTDLKSSFLSETSNGRYVHISHPQHPLTLSRLPQQNKKQVVVCVVCQLPIQTGSSTYFCSECDHHDDVYFHKQCAELQLKLRIPDHPHPLHLQNILDDPNVICHACRNHFNGFMYSCLDCNFLNLHIPCLQNLNHKHIFTKLRSRIIKFKCGVCGETSKNTFVWFCEICHVSVHEECCEFSPTLRIYEHHHDLIYFNYFSPPDVGVIHCMICGEKINWDYAGYGCSHSQCNYFIHFSCAKYRCVAAVGNEIEQQFNINHPHSLTIFAPEEIDKVQDKVCDGCMKCLSISASSHGCGRCDFYLHEECAKLPTKIHTRLHPPHSLTLISIPNFIFQCEACLQHFHGFAYQCQTCLSTFDVRCASIQTPFPHPSHIHPLFLFKTDHFNSSDCDCVACGENLISNKLALRCVQTDCEFHLDLRCATLPVKVRYRFDQHPLNLTFVEEERTEEYYCDICEEERESGVWFYSCQKCRFEAHQRCALGEFPFVKSAMHKSHKHPLNLAITMMKDQGSSRGCGACNKKSSSLNLAFQCGACKFNVHATGQCYDLQQLEGNLVFTNYNVFSRANQPYDQSILRSLHVMELGPFGSFQGIVWKESVFSSIRAFVVYHSANENVWVPIQCIQIQYLKKGELVWSSHGQEKGTKSEVSFDYPDEYLVSIHGSFYGGISVSSLTLETNKKTYGPFGVEEGDKFSSVKEGVKIIAIFGMIDHNNVLCSIGFHGLSTNE